MENKNYGEIFCQATEILAQHLIEQISFDRTILCTIVDDSEKNIGKYRVSNTDMTFDAYTSDTSYKVNDNVYVSIPGGDWNEQKLIVSKKANDSETMVEYINPYDRFINITNNIIPTNSLTAGLVANDINKKQILLWSYNSNEDSTLKSGGEVYAGYTRLALSGFFQTLLKSFDVRFGDYGLNLVIKTAAADRDETAVKVCNLNCADMTGNPYNYQGFFPQAKIFDISNINKIIEMELWFYQKAGSFKNAQGAAIPYENIPSNILVKDINVALGYDTQSFDKDTLILYTQDLTDYDVKKDDESNHKKLEVRWIHKFDENGKIKVVELDDGIDYNLTFYRHSLGESSHSVWSGVDWAFLSSQTVIEGEANYIWKDAARDPSYNAIWLKPDYNKAQEKIKAILTYNNNEEVLFSSILTINNANEVVSQETVNAVSALNINCEDNSNGNYFLYRLDGRILDSAYSQIKRVFKLYFNTYGDTNGSLVEAESIEWIIPANNTMINLYPDQGQELKDDGFYHVFKAKENITENNVLYYTINSSHRQQNNNNTVKCVVVRNQIEYTAIKELTFGTAGTAGTDYTFILDFADNRYNALTVGANENIEVEATLYDYTGKKLDISDRAIEWSLTTDGEDDGVHSDDGYIIINSTDSNKTKLQFNPDKPLAEVPDDNYTILKAVLTDWGDFDLEAYLPIPIRSSIDYQFISGATTIVYNSLGYLDDTFQNPYIIYKNDGIESIQGNWTIKSGVENDPCIPSLKTTEEGTILKPVNIYVEDTMAQLCVTGSDKGVKVWSQPIYAYQNKYPTSIVNDWNGELQINEKGNAILAAKVVAGKKNTDNTFTGVMMGDWDDSDTEGVIQKNTGIYGFRQGAATFGFKDDGTAFIGEAGRGRLEFDGEKSTIQSAKMVNNKGGMLLDFDDGIIKLVQYDKEKDTAGENSILFDASSDSTLPISVGEDKKFKIDWEGNIEAEGKITATSGKIGAWMIEEKDHQVGDEQIEDISTIGLLHTNKTYLFPDGRIRIGSLNNPKFEVQPDGTLISKGGSITITKGLKTIFQADSNGFELADGKFVYTEEDDTLKLTDVKLAWMDDNDPPTLEDYLADLQETADGKNTIYANMPVNPQVGDLLVPDENITHDGRTYYKGRVYKYTKNETTGKETWEEVDYANTGVVDALRSNVITNGKKISNIFHYNTEITEDSIISPAIGGGYLNITGKPDENIEKQASVIIDPSNVTRQDQVFQIKYDDKIKLGIDKEGNATFEGNIIMNGGTISWDKVADNGAYSLASSASSNASTALNDILNLAKGEYTKGGKTFINGRGIYSPTIVGGKLYATDDFPEDGTDATDYTEITKEGLKICRDNSEGIIVPKFEILVGREDYSSQGYENTIRIAIGAGEITDQGAAGSWEDKGRLILEKDETNTGKIYIKGGTNQYSGIIFNYNKLSFFEGSTVDFTGCEVIGLEGVEGGTAVFG